ncbi:unnamed protein product [Brachionus calyciflorus]|uniref:Uncharacterized protein n=1 Tax=Brachionus calyciflorus TaxID=104777 RepID=A0A814FFD9_9BILA|nr:unnamed protein product [Brachionus calyciflorus]
MDFHDAFEYIENLSSQVGNGIHLELKINDLEVDNSKSKEYGIKTRSKTKPILGENKNLLNIQANKKREKKQKDKRKSIVKLAVDVSSDKENSICEDEPSIIILDDEQSDDIIIIDQVTNDEDFRELIEKSFVQKVKTNSHGKNFSNFKQFTFEVLRTIFSKQELSNGIFLDHTKRSHSNVRRRDFDQEKTKLFKDVIKVHYSLNDKQFESFWQQKRSEINQMIAFGKF